MQIFSLYKNSTEKEEKFIRFLKTIFKVTTLKISTLSPQFFKSCSSRLDEMRNTQRVGLNNNLHLHIALCKIKAPSCPLAELYLTWLGCRAPCGGCQLCHHFAQCRSFFAAVQRSHAAAYAHCWHCRAATGIVSLQRCKQGWRVPFTPCSFFHRQSNGFQSMVYETKCLKVLIRNLSSPYIYKYELVR